jgi:hypothetical protein
MTVARVSHKAATATELGRKHTHVGYMMFTL